MGNYLIPANTKRGQLIFGVFELFDLIMFGVGVFTTLMLVIFLPIETSIWIALLALLPALVTGLLVLPVAHYYNVRQLIVEIYNYFTSRNRFVWKGWCFTDEQEDSTK